jgi:hypothetical protein
MAKNVAERYAELSVDELREEAKKAGIGRVWDMRKEELIDALARASSGGGAVTDETSGEELRSKSLKYAKAINSPEEHQDRPGQTLVTRNHEVIRRWAEERGAIPATVPGTEHDGRPGVLTFDFPGYGGQNLKHISWDEWFRTFDERNLNFIYQEQKADGNQSNFFHLESPEREDG